MQCFPIEALKYLLLCGHENYILPLSSSFVWGMYVVSVIILTALFSYFAPFILGSDLTGEDSSY